MELQELFREPPSEYRQAPLWFWNHELAQDVLAWQIDQMKDKGLGGFIIQARRGLATPYLSEAWFDCVRFCCRRAKEQSLTAWASDEPRGFMDASQDASAQDLPPRKGPQEDDPIPITLPKTSDSFSLAAQDLVGDFQSVEHKHVSGADAQCGTDSNGLARMSIASKVAASAGLLAGNERIISQPYEDSGWGLSLRDMKAHADCQMVHGISFFSPHAFYYSVAGSRKRDAPPSEFFQAPFWPYYKIFADYTARLTSVLAAGRPGAKIAVLWPKASTETGPEAEKTLVQLGKALQSIHRDFLVVDEDSLAEAQVRNDRFSVKTLEFQALIVPSVNSLPDSLLDKLREIGVDCPVLSVGNDTMGVVATAKGEHDGLSSLPSLQRLEQPDPEALRQALAGIAPEVILEAAPEILYLQRQRSEMDFYFFVNTSGDECKTVVSLDRVGKAAIWDADTGDVCPAPGQQGIEGRLSLPLTLPPQGSVLVSVDTRCPIGDVPEEEFVAGHRIRLCDLWHFTPENGNFLRLNKWHMTITTRHSVTELSYATDVILNEAISNMRLILDSLPAPSTEQTMEGGAHVYLNGEELTEELPWEIDPEFRVLRIAQRLDPGQYRIEIVITSHGHSPQPDLAEYAWLAGDFKLDLSEGMPRLSAVRGVFSGPWEQQGFPFFSGTGAYMADFDAPEEVANKRVFLDAGRVGDVLTVEVNGQPVAVRAWPPYRVELTGLLHPGRNLFALKVANSNRNFIEGPDKDTKSGLLEEVCIEIER